MLYLCHIVLDELSLLNYSVLTLIKSEIEMNIKNLVPRTINNVEVRYIPEIEWYQLTGEPNQDGYGVFRDNKLIYSNHDPIEASYFFDEETHEYTI